MKTLYHLLVLCFLSLSFFQCANTHLKNSSVNKFYPVSKNINDDEEDGIKEVQEMEFQLTRDISLNYIPKDRLIKAINELYISRKNNSAYRENALSWTERGPYLDYAGAGGNTRSSVGNPTVSGRIRAIWVDLSDATNKTVWVGSASGGLWKTNDVTASPAAWIQVNDYFASLSVSSICQDPNSKNIMYFGTGEKSYNADAVRGAGIWKSTDYGNNWTLLPNTTNFSNVSKIVCDASGFIYVASNTYNGVQRSTNGGASFTNITPTGVSTNVVDMNLSSTGKLHIAFGYFNSSPSGYRYTSSPATVMPGTWTAPVTVYTNTGYNTTLASNGNILYATPSNSSWQTDKVWKSIDGGANWLATGSTPPIGGGSPLSSGQAWYCQGLAVDPNNANNVMVGGLNSYKSTDGGATWNVNSLWVSGAASSNYIHADHQVYEWSVGNQLLCGSDGGLFYSGDGGNTFTDRNQGLRIKQFYSGAMHPTSPDYFLAGAQDNGVHQLNGAGLTSSLEIIGGDGAFVHIDQNEPEYQFGAYVYNQYRVSTDGGASFSYVNFSSSAGQFINPTDYDDVNNNFYGAWSAGSYMRWINAPQTANYYPTAISAFNGGTVTHVYVSPYVSNRVFFGVSNGKIVKADNAHSASPISTDITGSGMPASSVSCITSGTNDNNLIATFSNYGAAHVWLSTVGGGTAGWTNISGNLPDIPVRWAMFNPEDNTKAILATEMGIYETTLINGASTLWVQNSGFPVVRTDMLQYRYTDNTILAATHGRGLYTATLTPAVPYVRFASSFTNSPVNIETTSTTANICRNFKDYTINMHIDAAPSGSAVVNLSIAGGATATQGSDFDFTTNGSFAAPSAVITFANGTTADQPITIRVYNDAQIEGPESFTFNYAITGSTNAQAAPSSTAYIFNIGNNNTAPLPAAYGGVFTLGVTNTSVINECAFKGDLTKQRIQYLFTAAELNAAGISGAGNITSLQLNVNYKGSSQPYSGFTIALGNTTAATMIYGFPSASLIQVYSANYSTVMGNNLFNFSTPFNWDGTSNVLVNMCFDNGSSVSSYDVIDATQAPLGAGIRAASWSSVGASSGCTSSAAYVSDARPSMIFGANNGNPVETVLNNNRSEYISNNGLYYIYNGSKVINSINNASANLGCVNSSIFAAGNSWSPFQSGEASQKIIQITPTTNVGSSYTIGLYYTMAELGGKLPSSLKIAKTSATTLAGANSSNTIISTTTSAAFGTGYLFTANFTAFSKFFLIDNNVVLPVEIISFNGVLNNQQHSLLQWRTTNQYNLRDFEIQRSYDGVNFTSIGLVKSVQITGSLFDYNFIDPVIANSNNFYRLKIIDQDGKFRISDVIQINNNRFPKFVELLENPAKDHISILINNANRENVSVKLFNSVGQLVKSWDSGKINGSVSLPFNISKPTSGLYTLQVSAGDKSANFKVSIL